jgi:RNA polymerase sigma-70 factor (ECF subfamily)
MLEGIPEIYRTVVILHYLEDLSLEQIAKTLDISLSSVKMRLKRAREYIKEKHKKEEFYV